MVMVTTTANPPCQKRERISGHSATLSVAQKKEQCVVVTATMGRKRRGRGETKGMDQVIQR